MITKYEEPETTMAPSVSEEIRRNKLFNWLMSIGFEDITKSVYPNRPAKTVLKYWFNRYSYIEYDFDYINSRGGLVFVRANKRTVPSTLRLSEVKQYTTEIIRY